MRFSACTKDVQDEKRAGGKKKYIERKVRNLVIKIGRIGFEKKSYFVIFLVVGWDEQLYKRFYLRVYNIRCKMLMIYVPGRGSLSEAPHRPCL